MKHLRKWSLKFKDPSMAQNYEDSQRKNVLKTLISMTVIRLIRIVCVTVVMLLNIERFALFYPHFLIVNYFLLGIQII